MDSIKHSPTKMIFVFNDRINRVDHAFSVLGRTPKETALLPGYVPVGAFEAHKCTSNFFQV